MNGLYHFDADRGGAPLHGLLQRYQLDALVQEALTRYPQSNPNTDALALHQWRADALDRALSASLPAGARADAAGLPSARDLEHRYAEVVTERFRPMSAFELFTVDTSVPIGAETHTLEIQTEYGKAAIYRPGSTQDSDIPTVDVGGNEVSFKTAYIVTSWNGSIFENFSLQFANRMVDRARVARRIIEATMNDLFWNGSEADNLYGVLTFPWLPKAVSGVTFQASGTFSTMLNELNRLAQYAKETSGGAFKPSALAVGIRLMSILKNTRHAQDPSLTLLKAFQDSNPEITSIREAHELDTSTTAAKMLFYENSRDSMALVMPAPFTILPTESRAFGNRTYVFAKIGGAVSRYPSACLLVSTTIA